MLIVSSFYVLQRLTIPSSSTWKLHHAASAATVNVALRSIPHKMYFGAFRNANSVENCTWMSVDSQHSIEPLLPCGYRLVPFSGQFEKRAAHRPAPETGADRGMAPWPSHRRSPALTRHWSTAHGIAHCSSLHIPTHTKGGMENT